MTVVASGASNGGMGYPPPFPFMGMPPVPGANTSEGVSPYAPINFSNTSSPYGYGYGYGMRPRDMAAYMRNQQDSQMGVAIHPDVQNPSNPNNGGLLGALGTFAKNAVLGATGGFVKDVFNGLKSMVTDPNGNFDLGKAITSVGLGALAVGSLFTPLGPFVLAGLGAYGLAATVPNLIQQAGTSASDLMSGNLYAFEEDGYHVGEATTATGLAVVGAATGMGALSDAATGAAATTSDATLAANLTKDAGLARSIADSPLRIFTPSGAMDYVRANFGMLRDYAPTAFKGTFDQLSSKFGGAFSRLGAPAAPPTGAPPVPPTGGGWFATKFPRVAGFFQRAGSAGSTGTSSIPGILDRTLPRLALATSPIWLEGRMDSHMAVDPNYVMASEYGGYGGYGGYPGMYPGMAGAYPGLPSGSPMGGFAPGETTAGWQDPRFQDPTQVNPQAVTSLM